MNDVGDALKVDTSGNPLVCVPAAHITAPLLQSLLESIIRTQTTKKPTKATTTAKK